MSLLPRLLSSALAAGMALLALAGCSGPRAVTGDAPIAGFPNHSLADVSAQLRAHHVTSVHAYEAETALSLRSPAQSGSFAADIRHRQNDSLMISVSPGFGIVAVRALITPDSVFIHDRINRELTFGSLDAVGRFLPLPSSPDALYATMLGFLLPDATGDWQLSTRGPHYVISSSDGRRGYTVDPLYWRIVRYEERNGDGALIEERTFSEFERYTDVYVPRRLTLRRPGDDTSASLYYRTLTLNPPALSFDFQVGRDVRRVPLD